MLFSIDTRKMEERVRAHDWSQTSLGPIEGWPNTLRVAVEICLSSRFPMHVWWGPDLINIYNDEHIRVLGKRHPDALGRSAPAVWTEVWPMLAPQVEAVMQRGESTWNERTHVVLERNGLKEDAWFTWSYSPIRDEAGRISGLMCISTEDTARVLAEQERDRLEEQRQRQRDIERTSAEAALRESNTLLKGISDSTGDAIFAKDREGRLRFANPATLAVIGKPMEQVLGKTDVEVLADANFARVVMENDRRIMESGVSEDIEEIVPFPDGSRRIWLSRKMPNFDADGRVIGLLGVARDITDQKRAEEALVRRTDELARSNLELERFAHVASHDLQEPLITVQRFVQLLRTDIGDSLKGDAQEFLNFIFDGVQRMQRLVNDLLVFSRVGSQGAPFAAADCREICERVLENLRASIHAQGASVTVEPLPVVIGDATQLGQIFQNLLSNAMRFHGERTPQIRVLAKETPREWVFSVADNGIGISPQYFERIFIIFQRLHTIEEYGGTGIGLAICKKIAERHGGRIWVESELGKGSTFYFSISKREKVT